MLQMRKRRPRQRQEERRRPRRKLRHNVRKLCLGKIQLKLPVPCLLRFFFPQRVFFCYFRCPRGADLKKEYTTCSTLAMDLPKGLWVESFIQIFCSDKALVRSCLAYIAELLQNLGDILD